jgi:predicted helicase
MQPDDRNTWLRHGLREDFDGFIHLSMRTAKQADIALQRIIFKSYSLGAATNRDEWVYDFDGDNLKEKVNRLIRNYEFEVMRYLAEQRVSGEVDVESFVNTDPKFIKWTDRLKTALREAKHIRFDNNLIRASTYRPFVTRFLYFDSLLVHRRYRQHLCWPNSATEAENRMICLPGVGNRHEFGCLMVNRIPALDLAFEKAQCFPFYTYSEDRDQQRENVTDWTLKEFKGHCHDEKIAKWDIFHYVYAVLHHPQYRERYAANLRRELPRILYVPDFHGFAAAELSFA